MTLLIIYKHLERLPYLCVFFPFLILSKLSYAYAVFFVRFVYENLDVMNDYIKSVSKQNGYYIRERSFGRNDSKHKKWNHFKHCKAQFSIETLHFMKSVYCLSWETITEIKSLTIWSMYLGLFNDFFVLTFNLYWFATFIFFETPTISAYFLLSVLIANNLGSLLFIAHNCSKIVEAVSEYAR